MEEKIYGLDTGGYDPERVAAMADWELFLEYYSVTLTAWRIRHDANTGFSRGYVSETEYDSAIKDLGQLQYPIEYLLYTISKRNGIEVNEPEAGQHITPNRDVFMKWYRYYDDHFMHQLSDVAWKEFEQKRKDGADVSEYLPKGDWRSYEAS